MNRLQRNVITHCMQEYTNTLAKEWHFCFTKNIKDAGFVNAHAKNRNQCGYLAAIFRVKMLSPDHVNLPPSMYYKLDSELATTGIKLFKALMVQAFASDMILDSEDPMLEHVRSTVSGSVDMKDMIGNKGWASFDSKDSDLYIALHTCGDGFMIDGFLNCLRFFVWDCKQDKLRIRHKRNRRKNEQETLHRS